MRLLIGHDEAVANWIGLKLGCTIAVPYRTLGWLAADGRLSVGALFFAYVPNGNIDLALASSGRLHRSIFAAIAHYAFVQLGVARITARPSRSMTAQCAMLKRAGFVQECIAKNYFGTDDAVQFRLLKQDCRWLLHKEER